MPTDQPRHESDDAPELSGLWAGDRVRLHVGGPTTEDFGMTVKVEDSRTWKGGTELTARLPATGERVTVYGDHYPPVVERAGSSVGRLHDIELVNDD